MANANHFVATLNIKTVHYSKRQFHCFEARKGFGMCKLSGKSDTLDPYSVKDYLCKAEKRSMEQLMCTNMASCDKMKPFLIEKSQWPCCFKG
jgi:hypothetical protein